MKAYPGKNSTNITPKTLRTYASGYESCGTVKTIIVVAMATAIMVKYHAASDEKRENPIGTDASSRLVVS